MANEKFTQLPTVASALTTDIIAAVQGGISVQETLSQVIALAIGQTILHYAGNPNGNVAGSVYQLCWDTTNTVMYVCTVTGTAPLAVWTKIANSPSTIVTPTYGGTGVANPTAHTLPVAEGSSNFNFLGPLTNGQLLIGSTGADPVPATLTATGGISILNAAGSITISGSGGGFTWTDVTGTTQAMTADNGYFANNAGTVTFTLPVTAAAGTVLAVMGKGAGGWAIAQNVGQSIVIGSLTSTIGVGGSIASTNAMDSIYLTCITADTVWSTLGAPQGNITVV